MLHKKAAVQTVEVKKPLRVRLKNELVQNKYIYILAIPVILYYLIFCYGPMCGIVIAFKQYTPSSGLFGGEWVGLRYFKEFFSSMYCYRLIRNTLLISFYGVLIAFPAPIVFALLLNEVQGSKFKKTIQTVTYLPHFISLVVICGMIMDFFSTNGIVTKVIHALGGPQVNYLGDAKYFRTIYIATDIWQGVGWGSIIYLAALAGIDQELYEAAVIDGAGRWKQMLHVTLPGLAPTIIIMLIMRIGQVMSVGYEKIILLYNPSTYETADVISSFVYRRGLGNSFEYSYTTAVGLFQSVVNLVLLVGANAVSRKFTDTSLY
ncbi:ABC transporter permease [Ructibacterium gallinarum]|uniref:Sugar ABC transporter permease n=1 Tax=Ructibacterium gallinarum TaxID=2779355 RepID=A0A9D5M2Q9_9FIRM|nr:ABC transporter permease subunit [Ructibacterium gallinarum]MBE5040418.1 sugar ABC transporter permease [Ructibacterium gallinarum]